MKVLLLNGSPNAKGCTYTALSLVAESLKAKGIETEIFQIGKGDIHGCIGCGVCKSSKQCVFTDESFAELQSKVKVADGLVIGSPVYFASPNGSLISLLDRLFYASGADLMNKPAAIVVSARRAGTTSSLDVLYKYPAICGMPIVTSQYWTMVHGNTPEEVLKDLEGVDVMRKLGDNLAYLLACIEAGKEKGITPPSYSTPRPRTNFIR